MEGVNRAAIEPHEESATLTGICTLASGILSLVLLLVYRAPKVMPQWGYWLLLLLTLASIGAAANTARLGGRIHHPELEIRRR